MHAALLIAATTLGVAEASLSCVATFNQDGMTGTITFSQDSATSNTSVVISLTGVPATVGPWHVHQNAITNNDCSNAVAGGHYNPFNVPLGYSTCPNMSTCEVGDMSTKLGPLTAGTISATYVDTNLPLFGEYTVIGRSIVIHNSTNSARWTCATLESSGSDDDDDDSISPAAIGLGVGFGAVAVGIIAFLLYRAVINKKDPSQYRLDDPLSDAKSSGSAEQGL